MKTTLLNLALIKLNRFCIDQGIPVNGPNGEGSHVVKREQGFIYDLVSATTGKPIASVTFHKSQVPTFQITTEPTPEFFTVVAVSQNTNNFGLKSIVLLHEDGRGKQILKSLYGGDKLPEEGNRIECIEGRLQCGSYECPSDLPKVSADVAAKILKTVRKQSK